VAILKEEHIQTQSHEQSRKTGVFLPHANAHYLLQGSMGSKVEHVEIDQQRHE
jgi:hypothetical protein